MFPSFRNLCEQSEKAVYYTYEGMASRYMTPINNVVKHSKAKQDQTGS